MNENEIIKKAEFIINNGEPFKGTIAEYFIELCKLYKQKEEELKSLKTIEEEHRKENGELRQKYEELVRCILEDVFYEGNDYVETTLRCLKRQGLIQLKEGQYIRPDLPYEEDGSRLIGVNHKRDKDYFIEDNELDEYTKALERELKEYYEAQKIFKKYNIKDETMYECIKRMASKINELEEEKENEEK